MLLLHLLSYIYGYYSVKHIHVQTEVDVEVLFSLQLFLSFLDAIAVLDVDVESVSSAAGLALLRLGKVVQQQYGVRDRE